MSDHVDFQNVYNRTPHPILAFNKKQMIVYANTKAIGDYFPGRSCLGKPVSDVILITTRKPNEHASAAYIDPGADYTLLTSTNERRTVSVRSAEVTGSGGEVLVYCFVSDITLLKKNEGLLSFLNAATEELSRARDTKTALDKISGLIVPKFATWFSIDLLQDGKLTELSLAHEKEDMVKWARKYREAYPIDLNGDSATARVLRTGVPNCVPVITREMISHFITEPEQLAVVNKLNLQSIITVAIFIKDKIAGVISFLSSSPEVHYDQSDLQFAQNFANHVGLALENIRLNEAASNEINARKQIETKLSLAQSHLQSALSSGLVGTWIRDLKRNILFADESLSQMFGLPYMPQGCDPEMYQQLILPDDQEPAHRKREDAIKESQLYEMEYRVNTADGLKWFFARGKTETDPGGLASYFTGVMIDITARKNAESQQKENENLFRFLADAVPHKIWISGIDGVANYYNKGWYDYSGIATFQELRSVVWDMLHPDDRVIAAAEFPRIIESGEKMEMEQRLRRSDGQYRWHLTRLNPHRDESGNVRLWVGTCTDIHEQKESEHRKDEFFAIASHELKTPLTNVKAYNQLMDDYRAEPPLDGYISKSAKSIYRLERLINDLLDVTKLNAGTISYVAEPFNFREMLQDSIGNIKYNTTHQIILQRVDDTWFTGDRIRLEQVMNNLFSNAIKYSPKATKVLVNSVVEKRNIVVSVRDFGIGIAPENLNRLFSRYSRISHPTMRFDGLGLGLFLSSEILRYHKGSFWIESEQGQGSTFYFRLPLPAHAEEAEIKTDDFYKSARLAITVNKQRRRLEVDWTGFQDLESVKQGCTIMLEYLKRHQFDRIINDNSHVTGSWAEAVDWVGNTWFPLMERAGLRYFAHILASNIFAQLSAKTSIDIMAGIITTQYFTNADLARVWIESWPGPANDATKLQ